MNTIVVITPPDRPGTLAEITERLAGSGVNITDIDVVDDHRDGVVKLTAEPHDRALRALTDAGYHAASGELITIRLRDEPGALARIAERFREPAINIRSLRFARRDNGWAVVLLSTDDNERARELLADHLVL